MIYYYDIVSYSTNFLESLSKHLLPLQYTNSSKIHGPFELVLTHLSFKAAPSGIKVNIGLNTQKTTVALFP